MVDVSGLQTTIFDPSIANLFFSDNAADADIRDSKETLFIIQLSMA